MRSYEAARGLFSFLEVCSWGIIVIGGIVAVAAGAALSSGFGGNPSARALIFALMPGAGISLVGLYGLAMVQMARAGVDNAEYGQQALGVARQQLEVSREALTQGKQLPASYAALKPQQIGGNTNHTQAEAMSHHVDEAPSFANRPGDSTRPSDTKIAAQATAALPEPGLQTTAEDLLASAEEAELATVNNGAATEQVEYRNGMWHVGSRTFQSETPARSYASQLGVNKNAKLT
jgi:hypothetical protein